MVAIGHKTWAIPEGYIPEGSVSESGDLVSHEAVCFLNTGDDAANIEITLFFPDREPVGPYKVVVGARRTLHLRLNDLNDPEPVPRAADFSSLIQSNVPIVVQHTRLDSRNPSLALLSTIAYAQS